MKNKGLRAIGRKVQPISGTYLGDVARGVAKAEGERVRDYEGCLPDLETFGSDSQ